MGLLGAAETGLGLEASTISGGLVVSSAGGSGTLPGSSGPGYVDGFGFSIRWCVLKFVIST